MLGPLHFRHTVGVATGGGKPEEEQSLPRLYGGFLAEHGAAADALQRPLRSCFQARLSFRVRLISWEVPQRRVPLP